LEGWGEDWVEPPDPAGEAPREGAIFSRSFAKILLNMWNKGATLREARSIATPISARGAQLQRTIDKTRSI
jgi:hypothetical protein